MRRISVIVLCLLVAGAAVGTTSVSAGHHAKRHRLCQKDRKHYKLSKRKRHRLAKRSKRCRRTQHGVHHDVTQSSGEPSAVPLPPLGELIAPETACPGQSDESLPVYSQEATMGCMINFARNRAGDAALAGIAALGDSSGDKAGDIIQCGEFSHTACGRPFTYWLEQVGYLQPGGCQQAGENIAWGTAELGTVRSILSAWVHSPDHLENMLSSSFDEFGVGLQVGPLSGYPDAHVWVTHLGSHC